MWSYKCGAMSIMKYIYTSNVIQLCPIQLAGNAGALFNKLPYPS